MNEPLSDENLEKTLQAIVDKNISHETFDFAGMTMYPLTKYCVLCGDQRFTDDEIKILKDKNLSATRFKTCFPKMVSETKGICRKTECQHLLFHLTGGFDNYMLQFVLEHGNYLR